MDPDQTPSLQSISRARFAQGAEPPRSADSLTPADWQNNGARKIPSAGAAGQISRCSESAHSDDPIIGLSDHQTIRLPIFEQKLAEVAEAQAQIGDSSPRSLRPSVPLAWKHNTRHRTLPISVSALRFVHRPPSRSLPSLPYLAFFRRLAFFRQHCLCVFAPLRESLPWPGQPKPILAPASLKTQRRRDRRKPSPRKTGRKMGAEIGLSDHRIIGLSDDPSIRSSVHRIIRLPPAP